MDKGNPEALAAELRRLREENRVLVDQNRTLLDAIEGSGLVYWEWDADTGIVSGGGDSRPWVDYRDRVHPEDRERYVQAVDRAWKENAPYSSEYRVLGRDGAVRWILARGKAIRDDQGRAKRMIGVAQDVTERREQEEMVRFLAYHDFLTALPNRRLLEDRLKQALYQAERRARAVAVLLIDLDDFKKVNDSAGHRAGDAVLREVASRIGGCVRKADTLARLGGDEFVVVMNDIAGAADCRAVAEKVLRELEPAVRVEGGAFALGASIGIALYPNDGRDPDSLLRNADAAMYRAKELGRNCFRFFAS